VESLAAVEHLRRLRERRLPTTPAELGVRLDPARYRITPAVALVSAEVDRAIREPDDRLIICMPPRESKSTTAAVYGTLSALLHNLDTEVILASYGDDLAEKHSRSVRALITEYADLLGFRLNPEKTAAGEWTLQGHRGGLAARGILSGITGRGAGLMIVDDAIKNMSEADSPTLRCRVVEEFRATLMTRVHPGGSVIVIGTRWHPQDLIGTLLAEEPDRWRYVNVPAVAEAGVPDSLGRERKEVMVSAVGRTPEHFADLRASLGARMWWAEFQGVPTPPDGGLIRREWFDMWRLSAMPSAPVKTVIGVDPSDSGTGDACGIVAASLTADGVIVVHRDISEPMTPERWARAAIELAQDVGASEIAIETFMAREGYLSVVNNAMRRYQLAHPIKVSSWPPKGTDRGKGDALARSAKLIQGLETGTVRLVGHLDRLEDQAVLWQPEQRQHQPDCLAALTVAHDVLAHGTGSVTFAAPMAGRLGQRSGRPAIAGIDGATVHPLNPWTRRVGGGL
jgi:hypothetical protein